MFPTNYVVIFSVLVALERRVVSRVRAWHVAIEQLMEWKSSRNSILSLARFSVKAPFCYGSFERLNPESSVD